MEESKCVLGRDWVDEKGHTSLGGSKNLCGIKKWKQSKCLSTEEWIKKM